MGEGVTFSQVVCLARCNGAHVVAAHMADRSTEHEFRQHVLETSARKGDYIIAAYSRKGVHAGPVHARHSAQGWSRPETGTSAQCVPARRGRA